MLMIIRGLSKTLAVDLKYLLRELSGNQRATLSKQAFSKARYKIRHESFIRLNNHLIKEFYSGEYKKYRGYRLLAADGCFIQIPSGKENDISFGKVNNCEDSINMGVSMMMYDVLNDLFIQSSLHRYHVHERKFLLQDAQKVKDMGANRDLLLLDRGFNSLAAVTGLIRLNYGFIMRCREKRFLKEIIEFIKTDQKEAFITIDENFFKRRKGSKLWDGLNKEEYYENPVKLRIVKVKLSNGKHEYLLTTLTDTEKISIGEIKELYGMRWMIEEKFKEMKNTCEIENFSARKPEGIMQDFYARILALNLISLFIKHAEDMVNSEERTVSRENEKKYKINRNVGYGLLRADLFKLLIKKRPAWGKIIKQFTSELIRHLIQVKPLRSFERKFGKGGRDYPLAYRRAI